MNPTDGVISEAWEAFKAHWRHLVPIALVVYLAVGLISIVLVALLTWVGAILSFVIGLVALFWCRVRSSRPWKTSATAAPTSRSARPTNVSALSSRRSSSAGCSPASGSLWGSLLIVPGLILLTWWIVIIPVIVLKERLPERPSAAAGSS